MVEIILKPDPLRPGWFFTDERTNSISDTGRWRMASRPHTWHPLTDVYETEDALIVRVEVAGVRETDFNITLTERSLQVRGVRSDTTERRAYHQLEIPFGEFSTELDLPFPILSDQIEAVYNDGFLRILLPKARPMHIKVGNSL
jgi:HSP20 family molecular chaperone IbpA